MTIRIIDLQEVLHLVCPVCLGPMFRCICLAPTGQCFSKQKDAAGPISYIFIIFPFRPTALHWNGCSGFAEKLVWFLIHADDRIIRIIGLLIQIQNILHTGDKCGIVFGRDNPALFQVRLELVFFRTWPTAAWEMLSIISNSTARSARRRKVHFPRPCGGSLQLKAMILASTSPVILAGIGGVPRFFLPIATSRPFSEYNSRTVWTVCLDTFRSSAISTSLFRPRLLFSSAASKILACRIILAGATPLVIQSCNVLRSSAVKQT